MNGEIRDLKLAGRHLQRVRSLLRGTRRNHLALELDILNARIEVAIAELELRDMKKVREIVKP